MNSEDLDVDRYYPSRRDYFAAAAMTGFCSQLETVEAADLMGGSCVILADALIAELDRTSK